MGASLSVPGTETMLGQKGSLVGAFAHYPLPTTVTNPSTIVGTLLTADGQSNSDTTFTTGSITVASGDFVMAFLGVASASGNVGAIGVSGADQTWVRPSSISARFPDLTPDATRRFAVYHAVGVSGTGALTITKGAANAGDDGAWVLVKFTGVDLTTPYAFGTMMGSGPNAAILEIYARTFLDATYNASVAMMMAGGNQETLVQGSGYSLLGQNSNAGVTVSMGTEYKVGQDLVADVTWTNSLSNIGLVYELRASGVAANPNVECFKIGKGGTASDATSHSATTLMGAAPTYASAHPIYLVVEHGRTGGVTLSSTAAGGGVTWVLVAEKTFNNDGTRDLNRVQVFRTIGPLDGSDVVATHGQTENHCTMYMTAFPGADTTGSNGSGSVVQAVTTSAVGTASPSVTLAANASANNGVFAVHCTSIAQTSTVRVVPGNGMVTADHLDQKAPDPSSATPTASMFCGYTPFNTTTASATFTASGNTGSIGIEIKSA